MALPNFTRARSNQSRQADRPEVAGYINGYLPRANGSRGKIGAIKVIASSPSMQALVDELENGKPERVAQILSAIQWEYNSVTPKEGSEFVLED